MLPDNLEDMFDTMMFSFGVVHEYLSECQSNDQTPTAIGLLFYCKNQADIGAFCADKKEGTITPIDEDFDLVNKTIQ